MNYSGKSTVRVSDWSQKWKLILSVVVIIGFSVFVWIGVIPWAEETVELLREIKENTEQTR